MIYRVTKLVLLIFLSTPITVWAAYHYINSNAAGDKSGSDWENAFPVLPRTLVRGDTYYIAAGTYPAYGFSTAESAGKLITIKAATIEDHGTDSGWMPSYAGQVVFENGFDVFRGNLVIDGQSRASFKSGYGIKINDAGCDLKICWGVTIAKGVANVTLRYIEIIGVGDVEDESVENVGILFSEIRNVTMQYLYIHHIHGTPLVTKKSHSILLENSLVFLNRSESVNLSQAWVDEGSHHVTIRNNIFQDIEGLGFIVQANEDNEIDVADNWNIYGNVFLYTKDNTNNRNGIALGAIACTSGQKCANWSIFNNSIINIPNNAGISWIEKSTGSAKVVNNIWYGNPGRLALDLPPGSVEDFNAALNTGEVKSMVGRNDTVIADGAADPFVDWQKDNFSLKASTAKGINISAFNPDPLGVIRGQDGVWDRGAFEFVQKSDIDTMSSKIVMREPMKNIPLPEKSIPPSEPPKTLVENKATVSPVVAITAPQTNSVVKGVVFISASPVENDKLAGVQFKFDGINIGTEKTKAPYILGLDTTTASEGTHILTAVARDDQGKLSISKEVVIRVANIDSIPPSITILKPEKGSTVSKIILVSATAEDNIGVVGVQFKFDGIKVGSEKTKAPYLLGIDTSTASNGIHQISAEARDAQGNSTTANIDIKVENK